MAHDNDAYGNDAYGTETYGTEPHRDERDPGGVDDPPSGRRGSRVNVPTVIASAGVAAVTSALFVAIGAIGLLAVDNARDGDSSGAQPTVVNLGSAQAGQQGIPPAALPPGGAGALPPTDPAAGVPALPAPAEQVPAAAAPAAPAPPQAAVPPAAPETTTPAQTAAPTALSPAQLNSKVTLIMNPQASRAARAAELEGGARALGEADAVARALASYGNIGFSYEMVGPVTTNGSTMSAPLKMTLVGQGSRTQQLTWVWTGDDWKLSNRSVCAVTALALLPCRL
ncbi:hypothetical protein V1Y59_17070 [Gordonia sp. PKS22-38]|uniref:Low molecular weight antigen MTB12-like C-terminal domain-containing protein n=1 Tax=Gordonia prachuapensis TaxID=3115651 RepID=A0ABU7MYF8_9ACTN|nr:hypothetical protein [Gordonia sp. PKS22-38]